MARVVLGTWAVFLFGIMPYLSYSTMDKHTPMTIHPLRVYNSAFPDKGKLSKAPYNCRTDTECYEAEEDQWDDQTHVKFRDPKYFTDCDK